LVEHWDGTSWSTVKVPRVSPVENVFYAVSGTSSSDVWAAGIEYDTTVGTWKPLVEHWDGTSWSISTTPDLGLQTYIRGVAAISPTDAWLVGFSGSFPTLTEHWDGTSWTVVPASGGALNAVTALSSDDVWAVGQSSGSFAVHWDGVSWTSFPAPGTGPLFGAAGLSSADVWAVGYTGELSAQAIADHWDGSQWSESFSNHYPSQSVLSAVAASSPTDVWAVGNRLNYRSTFRTLIEHFDGAGWSVVPSPNANVRDDLLQGVAVDSTPGAWVVGWWTQRHGTGRTLIERYC